MYVFSDGVRDLMYVYYDYDVRILTTCSCDVRIFRRRTSSTDVRIIRHVRIFLAYAFYRRTHIVTTCFDDARAYPTDVRVRSTYVCYRRTHLPTYAIPRRTYSGNRGVGTTQSRPGFGTTQNTLDPMKKIPLARSGLILAPKIYD